MAYANYKLHKRKQPMDTETCMRCGTRTKSGRTCKDRYKEDLTGSG